MVPVMRRVATLDKVPGTQSIWCQAPCWRRGNSRGNGYGHPIYCVLWKGCRLIGRFQRIDRLTFRFIANADKCGIAIQTMSNFQAYIMLANQPGRVFGLPAWFAISLCLWACAYTTNTCCYGQDSEVAPFAEMPELNGTPPVPALSPTRAPAFRDLFDGKSLDGWTQRGGQAEFRVEDGAIVGKTRIATPNSFLCTTQEFADFELELEFKLENDRLNSGIQIRSSSKPEYKKGRVHGYQIEIDPTARAWTGGIYDEGRRGWLFTLKNRPEAQAAFRLGQWNRMRVVAEANRIKTWINEVPVADLMDDLSSRGFIALQIHASNEVMPMEIRWRTIRLKELNPSEPAADSRVETQNDSSN